MSFEQVKNGYFPLRKQQLAKLDELVKARFVEMFGDPGTDIYKWGMVSLGSICNVNPKKSCDSRLYSDTKISFVPMTAVNTYSQYGLLLLPSGRST